MKIDLGYPKRMQALAARLDNGSFHNPKLSDIDFEQIIKKFQVYLIGQAELINREKRLLAWAFHVGNPPFYTKEIMPKALELFEEKFKISILKGVFIAFFNIHPQRNFKNWSILANWLESQIIKYNGKNIHINTWKKYRQIFTFSGPEELGVSASKLDEEMPAFLDGLKIPPDSYTSAAILHETAKNLAGIKNREKQKILLKYLEGNKTKFPITTIKVCLDEFLQHEMLTPPEDLFLLNYTLNHLGHPRLDRKGRWVDMSQKSKEIIARWLVEDDLRKFFLEISGDKRRFDFWLKYTGKITYSKGIIGRDDERIASTELRELIGKRLARLRRPFDLSAVILEIDNRWIIIEFSQIGNAAYIYPVGYFKSEFWFNSSYYISVLKNRILGVDWLDNGNDNRFFHRDSDWYKWERKIARRLFEEFDIDNPF